MLNLPTLRPHLGRDLGMKGVGSSLPKGESQDWPSVKVKILSEGMRTNQPSMGRAAPSSTSGRPRAELTDPGAP